MRATYRVLALLIALGVVVQAAAVAAGWFIVLNGLDSGTVLDKNSEWNWGQLTHSIVGMIVIPVLAIVLLIVSFFARIPGGVKWAAIVFGLVALQIALAFVSFAVAPVLGLLHGANAFALMAAAGVAARKAGSASPATPARPVAVA